MFLRHINKSLYGHCTHHYGHPLITMATTLITTANGGYHSVSLRISLIPRFFPLHQRKIKTLTEGRGESLGTRLAQTACGTPTGEIGVVNCLFAPGTPNREDGCGQLPICTWYPQQRRWVWSTAYLHLVPPIEKMGVVNCLFHLCSIKCVLEQ